jgi:simple sugar transport system ATP-binding protein
MQDQRGSPDAVLRVEGIIKRFGSVVANDGVSLELYRSEIHGLLGENGSGKTTLCRIIYGQLRPDAGKIYVNGREVRFRSPRDAIRFGITMVHQELSLIPTLSVSENLVLARMSGLGVSRDSVYRESVEVAGRFGFEMPPDVPVYKLSYGERQRVEIVKALSLGARVLIMDEPTTFLTRIEAERLFDSLRRVVSSGVSVLFVSHRIDEVLSITNRITVLRAGKVVARGYTMDFSREDLVRLIVGEREVPRSVSSVSPKPDARRVALSIRGLYVAGDLGQISVRGVDLDLFYGEILGIAGVEGNGQRELFEAIAGLRKPLKGSIVIDDTNSTDLSPREIRDLGVAYVPEDPNLALVIEYPAFKNIVILPTTSSRYTRGGFILDLERVKNVFKNLVRAYMIKIEKPEQRTSTLSGGTKQKIVLARELHIEPRILLLYNPSKGLDIATTAQLKQLVISERNKGKAILYYSSDLDELVEISDRIAIIYGGRIAAVLDRSEIDVYRIAYTMTTGKDPGKQSQSTQNSSQHS